MKRDAHGRVADDVPFRQIHLDFHTSDRCRAVGADFDPDRFAATLRDANVASVNLFARCHHGYSYYPTAVGTQHPNLAFDLLGQQIAALHGVGIRAPVYVTLMWDDLAAERNPGWVVTRRDGSSGIRPPLSGESQVAGGWSWSTLDLASPYADYVTAQVVELCERYAPDGFWFDIAFTVPNYSPASQARMRDAGVDLADESAVVEHAYAEVLHFQDALSSVIERLAPEATIMYNHATDAAMRDKLAYQTHLEIESLPTAPTHWGYLHYPIAARQARVYGRPIVGMTGRFHRSWADFGGLKTTDQLSYEVGTILGAGGRVSIGDQLHPSGALDDAVYRLIGRAYDQVRRLEPWLVDVAFPVDVAIVSAGRRVDQGRGVFMSERSRGLDGAAQMFLELGIQFDIVDPDPATLARYGVLVLPDGTALDARGREAMTDYVERGGRLLATGDGADGIEGLPIVELGESPTEPSYLRLDAELCGTGELASDYDYVFYGRPRLVAPTSGAQVHGELRQALFERTWQHFTSHAQAPVGAPLGAPIVVRDDRVVYIAPPVFAAYRETDYWVYREMVRNILRWLVPAPLVRTRGPAWLETSLTSQEAAGDRPKRQIVHLTAYQPRRTLQGVPHVDGGWPLSGVGIDVLWRAGHHPAAYLAPDRTPLAVSLVGDYASVALPPLPTHSVVVLE
jgi:hypothetical protein